MPHESPLQPPNTRERYDVTAADLPLAREDLGALQRDVVPRQHEAREQVVDLAAGVQAGDDFLPNVAALLTTDRALHARGDRRHGLVQLAAPPGDSGFDPTLVESQETDRGDRELGRVQAERGE